MTVSSERRCFQDVLIVPYKEFLNCREKVWIFLSQINKSISGSHKVYRLSENHTLK